MIEKELTIKNTVINNRVVFQPMEGCDCGEDGAPGGLTVMKYLKAAEGGAGVVWFEACAVCPEGRTNVRQMMITEQNAGKFRSLLQMMREIAKEKQIYILQLTHSGRQSVVPLCAYHNSVYEEKRPVTDENIVTDEYLDTLPDKYAAAAKLAVEAGFDGVDIKSCHGYLLQELLSAYDRPGKYGGSFENRTRLYSDCIGAVKAAVPDGTLICTRLGVSDMVPYPNGFGCDENGKLDLSEPDRLIDGLVKRGIDILNVTVGNPYYNPHVNRPYRKGAYLPPEPPETGLLRFRTVEKHIKNRYPSLAVVGSGLSYYRGKAVDEAEKLLADGVCDLVGFGRLSIAYPEFYNDYLNGSLDPGKCCLCCSKCTELMRGKRESGCAVFNGYYRESYKEMKR